MSPDDDLIEAIDRLFFTSAAALVAAFLGANLLRRCIFGRSE